MELYFEYWSAAGEKFMELYFEYEAPQAKNSQDVYENTMKIYEK